MALKARAGLARRGRPLPAADAPDEGQPDPLAELSVRELLAIIDEEVGRLPRDSRLPGLCNAIAVQVAVQMRHTPPWRSVCVC